MSAGSPLRTLGLRRWYERQLIESHAYLVTGFLCLIVMFAGLEQLSTTGGWRLFSAIAMIAAATVVCLMAVRRYLLGLAYAEHVAEQGRCARCGAVSGITVLDSGGSASGGREEPWVNVRCRACAHQWLIR